METLLPFEGFYNSLHEEIIEHFFVSMFDSEGRGEIPENLDYDTFSNFIDWKKAFEIYSQQYVEIYKEFLSGELGINLTSLTFKELDSPKYYNYETDKIVCDIALEDVQALFLAVDTNKLKEAIEDRFTSRPGFVSFYSNNILEWLEKPLEEWDHNEISTLFECLEVDSFDLVMAMGEKLSSYTTGIEDCLSQAGFDWLNKDYDAEEYKAGNDVSCSQWGIFNKSAPMPGANIGELATC